MARVSFNRKTRPGVKFARVLMGMKGHRPSTFNACVGAKLKGKSYSKPEAGMGGMRDARIQSAFVQAAADCGADIGAAGRAKI